MDPNEVREALPTKTVRSKGSRIALPKLRYDPDTGEVRLSFPAGTSTDWKLTSAETALDVIWSQTHLGLSAELRGATSGRNLSGTTGFSDWSRANFLPSSIRRDFSISGWQGT